MKETANYSINEENYHYYFYKTEQLTFLCVLFFMILFGNISVLITLVFSKKRKTRMNFFIMHLAIADLLVGLINVLTDIIWRLTVDFYGGDTVCKIVKFSSVLVTYSSTYVLVSLSIDRYDAVTHPLNFSTSWRRARHLVTLSWFLSFLFAIPSAFLNQETMVKGHIQCWINLNPVEWRFYLTVIAFTLFFIPAIIITACYCAIVHVIWTKSQLMGQQFNESVTQSVKKIANSTQAKCFQPNQKGTALMASEDDLLGMKRMSSKGVIPRAKIKTVKMTFVIVIVFILCWSPYFVWDLLQVYGFIPSNQTTVAISTFIQSMAPLNSAANPIIYSLFSTHIFTNIRKSRFIGCFSHYLLFCRRTKHDKDPEKKIDYNAINSATRSSSSRATQHLSMTSRSSGSLDSNRKKILTEKCPADNGDMVPTETRKVPNNLEPASSSF